METRKLYYEDPMLSAFSARVLDCEESDKGCWITLDATAFYPEGGGQSYDTGTLGNVRVLEVREQESRVRHLCDGPLPVGQSVEGILDWQRRFDLMQQHTGEHILSGILNRRYGLHNVGFHVGKERMEVDFDGPLSPEQLEEAEQEANEKVWENVPLRCWYPSAEELPQVGYRSKRELPWPVRIVEVPGADKCACCGVHVPSTGQVGLIKIFSCTPLRGGVRLEMACGGRALALLSRVYEENRRVSQAFSAKILETGTAAEKMKDALSSEKFRAAGLEKRLLRLLAENFRGQKDVLCWEEGLSPAGVRELAEQISAVCTGTAAVLSGAEGKWDVCLVCPNGDVKALGASLTKALDGRGGGKPGFFQGSVRADRETVLAFFRNAGFFCGDL